MFVLIAELEASLSKGVVRVLGEALVFLPHQLLRVGVVAFGVESGAVAAAF